MNLEYFRTYFYTIIVLKNYDPTLRNLKSNKRTDLPNDLSKIDWFAISCALLLFHHTYLRTEVLSKKVMKGHSTLLYPTWG